MRRRFVANCHACKAVLPKCQEIGEPCALCGSPLHIEIRHRMPYVGEDLIGAYGSGPKDAPWPEFKDGPNRGLNLVPGGLKTLKKYGRENHIEWQ